jgi:vacuolar-type H+-ATPase subunit F/Vma7
MSKIAAVASGTAAMNLALTGMHVHEVADSKEAEGVLDGLMQDKLDVVIIEEKLRHGFSERAQDKLKRHKGAPLLVNCPSFDDEETDVDAYLSSVIKPAVGFEIRLV